VIKFGVLDRQLTKRAADGGDSSRFMGIFLASSLYCSQAESTLRPNRITMIIVKEKLGF